MVAWTPQRRPELQVLELLPPSLFQADGGQALDFAPRGLLTGTLISLLNPQLLYLPGGASVMVPGPQHGDVLEYSECSGSEES